jgi:histone H3/H4
MLLTRLGRAALPTLDFRDALRYHCRMNEPDTWKVCSICRRPIAYDHPYYACSVSTCNRKRTAMYFCSVACWEAHVPMMRHRDAWAEELRSPTEEAARQQREAAAVPEPAETQPEPSTLQPNVPRRVVAPMGRDPEPEDAELPRDVLVVISKLKRYVKARSGMNTSDQVTGVLSDHLRGLCRQAIRQAAQDGRKTVMDRDFVRVLRERA